MYLRDTSEWQGNRKRHRFPVANARFCSRSHNSGECERGPTLIMSMEFCPSVRPSGTYVMFARAQNHVTCILKIMMLTCILKIMMQHELEVGRQRRLQRRRQRERDRPARETPEERDKDGALLRRHKTGRVNSSVG